MSTTHYLISGGAGFIGSNLTLRLLQNPDSYVTIIDDLSTGRITNLKSVIDDTRLRFINADISTLDLQTIKEEIPHIDYIYHLACPASPPKYQLDPIATLDTSYLGTKNMLEIAHAYKATLLFSSTSEVYGDPEFSPQPESYRGNVNTVGPRACYDEGKRVAETLCYEYQKKYNLDIKIFRIFNTYGPLMDPEDGRVVTNFINQALHNKPLTIYGTGNQTRSFQYIDDLLDGILQLAVTPHFYGPINLGNPYEFTILELAQSVLKLIPESHSQLSYEPLPQDDPTQRKPDITLARKILRWDPKIQLEEGLSKTIEYFKQ